MKIPTLITDKDSYTILIDPQGGVIHNAHLLLDAIKNTNNPILFKITKKQIKIKGKKPFNPLELTPMQYLSYINTP